MLELQSKNRFFLIAHQGCLSADYACFFNPAYWQSQDRISGSAKGRGTTWFLQTADLFGVNTALRHYYRGGLWGKIVKDHYRFTALAETRSFAELRLLVTLRQAGLPVPKPIMAQVEYRCGFYRADILTEKIEHAQDLTAFLQHTILTEQSWSQIGGLLRRLHDLQIYHTDLNAHNILVQQIEQKPTFWLLDFDKCGQKSGSFWKEENLQRLHRSFMKEIRRLQIHFTEADWQALQAGYRQGEN